MNIGKYIPAASAIMFGLILTLAAFGQISAQTPTLATGQTIEREMTGKAAHQYKFDLKANEFFQILVEQKGVDVMLKLLDANGNVLATMDSPNGKEGLETLSFVTDEAGDFVLEVGSFDAKAEKGIYIIKREASRTATARDKRRIAIEKLFVEGMAARDAGQREIAIEKLKAALVGWEELKDNYLKNLTAQQVKYLTPIPPEINSVLLEIKKEDEEVLEILDEGQQLSAKSSADSLAAREKLNVALAMFRSLNKRVKDKTLLEKIRDSGETADKSWDFIKVIEFRAKMGEGLTLDSISQTYANLNERQNSIDFKKQAADAYYEIISDKTFLNITGINIRENIYRIRKFYATNLGNIGSDSAQHLGEFEEGINYLKQSVELLHSLYEENPDSNVKFHEAFNLYFIGSIYGNQSNNNSQAIDYFNKSLEIFRALPNQHKWVGLILRNVALRQFSSYDFKNALETNEKALVIYRENKDKSGESDVLSHFILIYFVLNDKAKVAEYANQNLVILQSPEYIESFKKSLDFNSDMFGIYQELNNALIENARLSAMGETYRVLEDYQKSLEYYQKALAAAPALKRINGLRVDTAAVASAYTKLKNWDKAAEFYKQALEISRKLGIRENIADDLKDVGWALMEAGKPQEALQYQNEALAMYQSISVDESKAFSMSFSNLLNEMSRTHYALGSKRLAIFYGKRAVNAMQGERQRLQNLDPISQKGFLEKKEKHYRRLAEWLIESGRFAEAEQVLRMLKEEEYSKFIRRDPEEINKLSQRLEPNSDERKILEKYASLADSVAKVGVEFEKLKAEEKARGENFTQQERLKELGEQLEIVNTTFRTFLEKELIAEFKKIPNRNIKVEIGKEKARQANLKRWNAVSIYTVVGEDRFRVFLTTPRIQTDGKKEITAKQLNEKIFAFRDALQNPNIDPRPLGKELYDILIAPVEKHISDSEAKTLIFSLDGTLRYIPIAALWDGEKYLVEKYQIVLLTAFTGDKLNEANRDEWKIFGGGVTGKSEVAEPERKSFYGLPAVKKELNSIIRENGTQGFFAGRRFLDGDFTREAIEKNLSAGDFNVLHLATHFKLGRDHATSFLLLGNNRTLTLAQIGDSPDITMDNIDLVVLSACETAFGTSNADAEGGEVDSSATFFELRGAKSVMASLWSVADDSTSELMIEFYRIRRENPRLPKAEALRLAQVKLLDGKYETGETPLWKRGSEIVTLGNNQQPAFKTDENAPFAHPYYWSPFILIGNWR